MSKLFHNKTEYDALTEYYFVDYHCIIECRWVRSAYLTFEEVREIIENLPYLYDKENDKTEPMFSDLRITPMRELEQLNKNYNEKTNEWENDVITNACKVYDWRYDNFEIQMFFFSKFGTLNFFGPTSPQKVMFEPYSLHFLMKNPYMSRTDLYLLVETPYMGPMGP